MFWLLLVATCAGICVLAGWPLLLDEKRHDRLRHARWRRLHRRRT